MVERALLIVMGLGTAGWAEARAAFVPGHIYVLDSPAEPCALQPPGYPNDRIWEVDPATGAFSLFAEIPDGLCGVTTGLAFTPDGTALRTASFWNSTILEINGDGNTSIALGPQNGIAGPGGQNGIAYNATGDFFVFNIFDVLKFPAAGGPPVIVGPEIWGPGPLAVGPGGDVYIGDPGVGSASSTILRLTPDGALTTFDADHGALSLTTASNGDLFALSGTSLFQYVGGDPLSRGLVASLGPVASSSSIALSLDEETVFWASAGHLFSVDIATGSVVELVDLPGFSAGAGIAVAVPEPALLIPSMAVLVRFVRRRR